MMMAMLSKHYSRHRKATQKDGDSGIHGKETWRKMWAADFRYRWRKMEVTA